MSKNGYVNGSDLLFKVDGKVTGHATSHTLSFSAEAKERVVKPVATDPVTAALFKDRSVGSMDISISCEGLCHYNEIEGGFAHLMKKFKAGQPVEAEAFERIAAEGETPDPYLVAYFIITSLEASAPAGEDATFSAQLQITGAPTVWDPTKITSTVINPTQGPTAG